MKTLYRLLALLLLASISHQLNAAPSDNDAGQSATHFLIATAPDATMDATIATTTTTANDAPDIGWTQTFASDFFLNGASAQYHPLRC